MWFLSAGFFVTALRVVAAESNTSKRPSDYIAGCAAILFALTSVRSTQPGVPPIGIMADMAGYYTNMVLISLALVMFLIKYFDYPSKAVADTQVLNDDRGSQSVKEDAFIAIKWNSDQAPVRPAAQNA